LSNFYKFKKDAQYFPNAVALVGTANTSFTLYCNASSSDNITWIQSSNKTGTYIVQYNSRVSLINNGLHFASLVIIDEEYYACGVINSTKLVIKNTFNLFIRGNPFDIFSH
jgi:hypothetical protein